MTEDNRPTVSSSNSNVSNDASTTKRRKKRRWDEPADILVSAGLTLFPTSLPLMNGESFARISIPGLAPVSNACIASPLASNGATLLPGLHSPLQHAVAFAQKLNPPKIQDELIAREIVINDADSAVRYKLTKRQTQEEIQKCTGAVVITRGKFIPPNAPLDGEKPLYLHISAGSHIDTTVERIKAVDRAAAMVEEMLKGGNNGVKGNNLLSTCVYLGFEPDPSWSIGTCIRGPNDQYINHIMNETGATVLLKGLGTDSDTSQGEGQQPLHLFLSSNNPKSLEQAKLLAENLLDTISGQFGASRVSSSKVYGAVPPPPQLLTEDQSVVNGSNILTSSTLSIGSMPAFSAISSVSVPGLTSVVSQGIVSPSVGSLSSVLSQPTTVCYPHSSGGSSSSMQSQPTTGCLPHASLNGGTSYNGYAGIYPQATPLQQVALALRQTTSPPVTASIPPVCTPPQTSVDSAEKVKRPPQKRKFQELPVAAKLQTSSQQKSLQESELQKPHQQIPVVGSTKNLIHSSNRTMMPPLNNSNKSLSNSMQQLPPLPKFMPPPPPKFNPPPPPPNLKNDMPNKLNSDSVPDTLIKLMEYGDDDDDDE